MYKDIPENTEIEFKEKLSPNPLTFIKTAVAFANGSGGKFVFGVRDTDHEITGIKKEELFTVMETITNTIVESTEPCIRPTLSVQALDGKTVINVEIPKGMQKPYFVKSLGLFEGAFIRIGGTTHHADYETVQELILKGKNRSFDQIVLEDTVSEKEVNSLCESIYKSALDFSINTELKKSLKPITKSQLVSWKIITEEKKKIFPSNAFWLLAGNTELFPNAIIRCAVFKGKERSLFIAKREIEGPLYEQVQRAYEFVLEHINLGSSLNGIYRQDEYELSTESVREIIANAVCHRSYLQKGSVQVAIFDDRLEVTSPGMIDDELSIEQMKKGLSKIRNEGIAKVFAYMNIIEAWGTGIPKIFDTAKTRRLKEPLIEELGTSFRFTLYRAKNTFKPNQFGLKVKSSVEGFGGEVRYRSSVQKQRVRCRSKEFGAEAKSLVEKFGLKVKSSEKILKLIAGNPKIKAADIADKIGISKRAVEKQIRKLREEGCLARTGSTKYGSWIVK